MGRGRERLSLCFGAGLRSTLYAFDSFPLLAWCLFVCRMCSTTSLFGAVWIDVRVIWRMMGGPIEGHSSVKQWCPSPLTHTHSFSAALFPLPFRIPLSCLRCPPLPPPTCVRWCGRGNLSKPNAPVISIVRRVSSLFSGCGGCRT